MVPGQGVVPSGLDRMHVLLSGKAALLEQDLAPLLAGVSLAAGAKELLFTYARNAPDVLVADLCGPDREEVLDAVKAVIRMNPEGVMVGVVDVDDPKTLHRALSLGMEAYLPAPPDLEALLGVLERTSLRAARGQELEDQKRLAELMVNGLPHPALLFDRDTTRILVANRLAGDMGLGAGKTVGPPLLPERVFEDPVLRSGLDSYRPLDLGEIQADGRTYEVTLVPASANAMLLFAGEVTRRKRLERQREDVERIVRHDLKTPINSVLGFTGLLMEEELPREQEMDFLSRIDAAGWTMLRMIDHSLDIFKMEEGAYVPSPEDFDLAKVLRTVRRDLEKPFQGKGLEVVLLLEDEPLESEEVEVHAERWHVENMLANLIKNAMEAAPEKSRIMVISSRKHGGAGSVAVDIHNQGAVPKEIRSRFFERYATSGKRGGTGLGTYSAKLIARAMGGDISFTSSEERGTTVRVTLPAAEGPSPQTHM